MIVLKGPENAEPGTEVCLTASGIGRGFQAKASAGSTQLKLDIKFNNKDRTATICFIVPPAGTVVTIRAANSSSSENAIYVLLPR